MRDPVAVAIVHEALALRVSHPHAPPRDVIDLVMSGRRGRLIDFGEHMVPPDSFAILVAEAMGDPTPSRDWIAGTGLKAEPRRRAALRLQYVLNVWPLFVERYGVG